MAALLTQPLDRSFGGVVLVATTTAALYVWMMVQVGNARRKYKISPPIMYVSESDNPGAKVYNCVQRAHQNSLEVLPLFLVTLLLAGIKHPVAATALGVVYIVGRYMYFTGYCTGDPTKRYRGMFSVLAVAVLILLSFSTGVQLLL